MTKLYGDGVHSDAPAIQEMLDSGAREIYLPAPEKEYLIDTTLKIHSNQTLRLDLFTVIRLKEHSDCLMLTNAEKGSKNIAVIGGIWNFDNKNQAPNPFAAIHGVEQIWERNPEYKDDYIGVVIRFDNVKNLTIRDITIKDPVLFGVQMAYINQFTVENVTFDYNYGNPWPINMDGIHLDGGCHFGVIRNLKGTCYDDLVALNADDFYDGPISDILIDGLFATDCHSAVRLLSAGSEVKNISISNVYGTYFQYCIGLSCLYYYKGLGMYDGITIRNIHASKAERYSIYQKDGTDIFAPIWIDSGMKVKHLTMTDIYREEHNVAIPLIDIWRDTDIERMSLSDIAQENHTGEKCPLIKNEGHIKMLYMKNIDVDDDVITGNGVIDKEVTL